MDLFQLSHLPDTAYRDLRQRIDLCARAGRSFELGDCRLPAHCTPGHAALGFWKQGEAYLYYLRPAVEYTGRNPALSRFFGRNGSFSRFEDLTRLLRSLFGTPPQLPAFRENRDYRALLDIFRERLDGQDAALEAVAFKLWGHIGKTAPLRPLSLIFYGPTCVGKSELGKFIAPALNRMLGKERYRTVWTELNTFTEAHSVYRLTGAPPGYAGYDDPPLLESVREQPYTVFLFDELDKAHPELLKVFMSILDEGRCTARRADEGGGWELDFRRCIFVFTTNADLSAPPPQLGFKASEPPPRGSASSATAELPRRLYEADEAARRAMVHAGVLREIAGRFSGLIGFQPLTPEARRAVTARQITALGREYGLRIIRVDTAIAAALTPADALSQRSAASVLEGVLGPVMLAWAQEGEDAPLILTGTPDGPLLCVAREPEPRYAFRGGLSPSPVLKEA